MILVTGSAGKLGRLVIESLLKKVDASQIVATVRNLDQCKDLEALGVTVRQGDYEKPEQWPEALKGVEKVLIITSSVIDKKQEHANTVIDAAKKSGTVELIAYTSLLHLDNTTSAFATEERQTEKRIKDTGLPFVMLRHTWYTENYADFAQSAVKEGAFYGAAKEGRVSGATRADLAEAAAQVLTAKQNQKSVYELAGDTSFTLSEVAAEMAKQSGKSVKYIDLPETEFADYLAQIGYPRDIADLLAEADTAVARGDLFDESHDLSKLIGRRTTSLADAVKAALKG